jgi:hypothetical protein
MVEGNPDITLETLHGDVTMGLADLSGEIRAGFADIKAEMRDMKAEMRAGFADMKVTLATGFAGLPSRESSEEMIRLLREGNRLQDTRFTQLDIRLREQHLETQQVLHALVEGQLVLTTEVRTLATEVRTLATEIKGLSIDIKGLVGRIDLLIRGRNNGEPPV